MRKLTEADVAFEVEALEEDIPVRGNAMASGDDEADRKLEDSILRRLNRGNLWAWCTVKVTARWKHYTASTYLGCCSYRNAKDFTSQGGYFDDMKREALEDLNAKLEATCADLRELR